MKIHLIIFLVTILACGCSKRRDSHQFYSEDQTSIKLSSYGTARLVNPDGNTILERFNPPSNFKRVNLNETSFGHYLRHLPLKPDDAKVKYYNGDTKNSNVYTAVVDMEIGNKDLHQCADAIIRLRAEYLFAQKRFEDVHFNFTNGFRVDYAKWMKGYRILVEGNHAYWNKSTSPSNTYDDFWQYLETIFTYAGTLSLEKELQPVNIDDLSIGDVFIQGGSPGHAVIVVDVAVDPESQKKCFLLAQSYMPAQDIQILKNPNDEYLSPWYSADFGDKLVTPEWVFQKKNLKRFSL